MKIVLIILAVIYGVTSLFNLLMFVAGKTVINYPTTNTKKTVFGRILAWTLVILWSIIPLLRWLITLGIVKNYRDYGLKEN